MAPAPYLPLHSLPHLPQGLAGEEPEGGHPLKSRVTLPKGPRKAGIGLSGGGEPRAQVPSSDIPAHPFLLGLGPEGRGARGSPGGYLLSGSCSSLPGPQLCLLNGLWLWPWARKAPDLRRGTAWKPPSSVFPAASSSSSSSRCSLDSTADRQRRAWPWGTRSPPVRNTSGTSPFMGGTRRPV